MRPARSAEWALIAVFLAVLWLPLVDRIVGLDASAKLTEKRRLATVPVWRGNWNDLETWTDELERFWNDGFGFRAPLVRLYNRTFFRLGVSPTPAVVVGRSGWLFYAAERALEYYRGVDPFTDAELRRWQSVLEARRDWLEDRGIPYIVVFAPNKETIYPEYMPARITRVRAASRLDQLLATSRGTSSLNVIDLRPVLRAAKPSAQLYSLTDSHWNALGAHVAYRAIMERVGRLVPTTPPLTRDDFEHTSSRGSGDIAGLLSLGHMIFEDWHHLTPRVARHAIRAGTPSDSEQTWTVPEGTLPRAVVFHDSFGVHLVPLLAEHFSRSTFVYRPEFVPEIIEREQPTVVVHELCERFLMRPQRPQSARVYGNRRLEEAFQRSTRVLFHLNGTDADAPIEVHGGTLDTMGGMRVVHAKADTRLSLPPVATFADMLPLSRLVIESPGETRLHLSYEVPGLDPLWQQAGWWPLRRGRNVVWLPVPEAESTFRIHLALRDAPGVYTLHDVEVRAIAVVPASATTR